MKTVKQSRDTADLEFAKQYLEQKCIESSVNTEMAVGGYSYAVLQVEDESYEDAMKVLKEIDALQRTKERKRRAEVIQVDNRQGLRYPTGAADHIIRFQIIRAIWTFFRLFLRL